MISISKSYPELVPSLKEKLSFFSKSKEEKIAILFQKSSGAFPDIPSAYIEEAKSRYLKDERSFSKIGQEITDFIDKMKYAEQMVNSPIAQDVLDDSILLIGPMGTGKTTVSKKLRELTGYPIISLDDRKQLEDFYKQRNQFKHYKEFEFYLTSKVLTSLSEPTIIDFGAGHSIYENKIMFYEIKKLLTRFKNIELLLPSQNLDESIEVLRERIKPRKNAKAPSYFEANIRLIKSPCNDEIATDVYYTKDKNPDEIATDSTSKQEKEQKNDLETPLNRFLFRKK